MTTDTALAGARPPSALPSRFRAWSPLRCGGAWMLGCLFLFAVMDVLQKDLAARYPAMEVMAFRSFFALLPLGTMAARSGGWRALATRHPWGHLVRSASGALSVVGFIAAFSVLPMAEVYAISFAGPLFVTALSGPLLGEAVGHRQWAAVAVGFLGVLGMIGPQLGAGEGMLSGAALLCLASTACGALATISVRRLSRTESNLSIVVYFALAGTVVGGIAMVPGFVMPDTADLALMAGAGGLCAAAQLAMTQAYRLAPAAAVAPLTYSSILWAVLFGALLFGERPGLATLAGTLVVVGSGLFLLHADGART